MQTAGTKYAAGIAAVRVAPGTLAAAAANLWAANVAASVQKFSKNVGAVSLNAWQEAATTKGQPRLATGATAASGKVNTFMTKFIGQLTTIVNGLPSRGGYDQNIAKLTTYLAAVHSLKGTF
jgi:hypothetical protein